MKSKKSLKDIGDDLNSAVLSPKLSKTFNQSLDSQISDEHIDDIFNNAISKGTGTAPIPKKTHKISLTKILICLLVAIIATIALVYAGVKPSFDVFINNSNGYVLNQTINVSSKNYDKISNITCYKDDKAIGELNKDNDYSIDIYENGTYSIVVKDTIGINHKKAITINNVDYTCPTIEISKNKDTYTATITDTESGVDFDTLKIVNDSKEGIGFTKNGNVITFSSDSPTIIISIDDKIGNTKRLILDSKK